MFVTQFHGQEHPSNGIVYGLVGRTRQRTEGAFAALPVQQHFDRWQPWNQRRLYRNLVPNYRTSQAPFVNVSTLGLKNRLPVVRQLELQAADEAEPLHWYEKLVLGVGVVEIPLQIDKYFMFQEADSELGAVAGINISITTVALVLLYCAWITRLVMNPQRCLPKLTFGWPMLFYIGVICLSSFTGGDKLLTFFDITLVVQAYLLFFFIANRVRSRSDVTAIMYVFLAALLVQSFIILWLRSLGESVWGEPFEIGPIVFSVWENGRAAGTMYSPVLAGSFIATLWLLAVVLFTLPIKGLLKWVTLVAVFAAGLALLVTQTRGAILTSAIGCIAIGVALTGRGWLPPRLIGVSFVLALAGIIPVSQLIEARVLEGDGGSAGSRIHLSAIAVEIIQEKPLMGHGAGNCHLAGERFAEQAEFRSLWYYTVHNKYLLVWIETGLVGLLAFLTMMFSSVRDGLRVWAGRDRFLAPIGFAFSIAIISQMLHMMVDIFNSRTQIQMLWAILGAVAAVRLTAEKQVFQARSTSGNSAIEGDLEPVSGNTNWPGSVHV